MRIGILQTGHLPEEMQAETGDYDRLFDRLLTPQGLDLTVWNVVDMEFPESIHERDGWLVTGSKHGVYEDHPWIPQLEDFIRAAYAEGIPLVGICFGHQIIAQALGGKVVKFPEGWAVGPQTYDWDGGEVTLNAWHQDQVIEPPKDATVISSNPFCQNAAFLYGKRAFTVQQHPEFTEREIALLLRDRAPGVVPQDRQDAAAANLNAPLDNARLAAQIADFFREAQNG